MVDRNFGPRKSEIPSGDNRNRLVCPDCGFIEYQNPKVVVGSVVTWKGQVLLCRRAIEPRVGFWTIPSGYMELGESVKEGALREAREEACIGDVKGDLDLLAIYTVRRLGQVHLVFMGELASEQAAAGEESLEVAFFSEDSIPWENLAFTTVGWALKHYFEVQKTSQRVGSMPYFNPLPNEADPPKLNF